MYHYQPASETNSFKAMIRLHITPVYCMHNICASPPKSVTTSFAAINSSYFKANKIKKKKNVYQE